MWVVHGLVRRPSVLVALTLLVACLPTGDGDATSVDVSPADLGALALVGAIALRVAGGDRPLSHRAWIPFALVLGSLAVATAASADPATSITGFIRYVELFVLIPVAVAAAVRDRWDVGLVGGTAVAVSLLEGVVGSWQYLTGNGASFGGEDVRAVGTFGAADVMGMSQVVGFGIVIALALGLALRGRSRWVMLAVAALLVLPMAFSLSRGSWIATVTATVATMVAASWRLTVKAAVALAAVAVIVVGGFGVGSATIAARAGSIAAAPDQSVSDRYGLWSAAAGMWADHPVAGVGLKNFPAFRDSYAPLYVSSGSDVADATIGFQREPLLSPHNMYMLILGEQGLIGISAFGVLFLALWTAAVRRRGRFVWPASVQNRVLDLAAPGVVVWTFTNFLYGDIGGPSSVFMATLLGLVVRRGMGETGAALRESVTARVAGPRRPPPLPAPVPVPPPVAPAAAPLPPVLTGRAEHGPPGVPPDPAGPDRSGTLATAALVSAVLAAAGMGLGLFRDLLLASYFGADGGTDAFLVAWTVPETAAPLLIEGAMAYLMVPLFSRALARGEPLRTVLRGTLVQVGLLLVALAAATFLAAPVLVRVLAPGLADPQLAVSSTRLLSVTVLMFGLAGYVSAALRASRVFAVPAAIYLAYNIGIVDAMLLLHGELGIRSAAVGVAAGSVLMVAVQLPSLVRRLGRPAPERPRLSPQSAITLAAVAPVALFTVARQAQVYIERYLGSSLAPGTISHLNYAQKVGQVPMVLALVLTTVTFPALARTMAVGDDNGTRRRVESDLRTVTAVVLLAAAYLFAFAPQVVTVLFQRGEFTAADTAATAWILRVYLLGLLGHAYVGVLSRPFFSAERPTWYPAAAMAVGLSVNAVLAALLVGPWGAGGIAISNGAGITVTAVLLLLGCRPRVSGLSPWGVGLGAARLAVPAGLATGTGLLVGRLLDGWTPYGVVAVGAVAVLAVFAAATALTDPPTARIVTALARGRGSR
jgi:murein biosynthesis integral membrane protein MurJ